MQLPSILQVLCIVGEAVVLAQALRYKLFRAVPIFVCYLGWNLFSDLVMSPLVPKSTTLFISLYRIDMPIDLVAQTAVFIEISWKLLQPAYSRQKLHLLAALVAAAMLLFVVFWPLTALLTDVRYPYNIAVRSPFAEQLVGASWFVILGLVGMRLSLSWRGRLLQIAIGLFSYSFFGVLLIIYRAITGVDSKGGLLQPLTILAYIVVLIYWTKSFSVDRPPVVQTVRPLP